MRHKSGVRIESHIRNHKSEDTSHKAHLRRHNAKSHKSGVTHHEAQVIRPKSGGIDVSQQLNARSHKS